MSRTRQLVIIAFLAAVAAAPAEDPKPSEGASSWLPILKEHAADYQIVLRTDPKKTLKPLPEPILRWTQPVRGGDDGAVFLWTADGRPEAVGTMFTYRVAGMPRAMQHEVHSLATVGLDSTWRERGLWKSEKPGLNFQILPDVAPVASTSSARLRQMQAIARDFSATSVHAQAGKNELRLMPKALYRYEPENKLPLDGALFCFAHGTDPEAFLVIETRPKGDAFEWQYAFARFSDLPLKARYKGRDVWEVGQGDWNRKDGPHAYYLVEQVNADTPQEYRELKANAAEDRTRPASR